MAAAPLNSEIIVAGILRRARGQADPAAWLAAQHAVALDAVMAGDEFITGTTDEAGSSNAERAIPATVLLQLYEAALQVYEVQTGGASIPGSIRTGDFSGTPCVLG